MKWSDQQREALDSVIAWLSRHGIEGLGDAAPAPPTADPGSFSATMAQSTAPRRGRSADDAPQTFRIAGLAGSGKTTLMAEVSRRLRAVGYSPRVVAPTGCAAVVLRSKGVAAKTIHKVVFKHTPELPENPPFYNRFGLPIILGFTETPRSCTSEEIESTDVFICDEASMVEKRLGALLRSFGKPVISVYDPLQLPPVQAQADPVLAPRWDHADVCLTASERQTGASPILSAANALRGGPEDLAILALMHGLDMSRPSRETIGELLARQPNTKFIVPDNKMVHTYNRQARALSPAFRGEVGQELPAVGEPILVTKNLYQMEESAGDTDADKIREGKRSLAEYETIQTGDTTLLRWLHRANGETGWIVSEPEVDAKYPQFHAWVTWDVDGSTARETFALDGFAAEGGPLMAHSDQCRAERRFASPRALQAQLAWAVTCHKAQGREFDHVAIRPNPRGDQRWTYTALTRAKHTATILEV